MSVEILGTLPPGFLKMKYEQLSKRDRGVQQVVVELAKRQNLKCALCSENRNLIIEHDHEPEEGRGDRPTIYNIRGLTCSTCNWHLNLFEKRKNDEYFGWDHAECRISDYEYEDYIYRYKCRVRPLNDALQEQRIGVSNPWHRRRVLYEFDNWFYGDDYSAWRERWAEDHKWERMTPEQLLQGLIAFMQFALEQFEKDPTCRPTESFLKLMDRVGPLVRELKADMPGGIVADASHAPQSF